MKHIASIVLVAVAGLLVVLVGTKVNATPNAASLKEVLVAAAAQVTLTSEIEVTDVKLVALGTLTTTLTDNPKTKRDYTYTVSLYVDGTLRDSATTTWPGLFTAADIRMVSLTIPDGMLWGKLLVVVTP